MNVRPSDAVLSDEEETLTSLSASQGSGDRADFAESGARSSVAGLCPQHHPFTTTTTTSVFIFPIIGPVMEIRISNTMSKSRFLSKSLHIRNLTESRRHWLSYDMLYSRTQPPLSGPGIRILLSYFRSNHIHCDDGHMSRRRMRDC